MATTFRVDNEVFGSGIDVTACLVWLNRGCSVAGYVTNDGCQNYQLKMKQSQQRGTPHVFILMVDQHK